MRPVESHEAFVGALVSWLHVPRGGYGYEYPVDAEIVALNLQGDRARIKVTTRSGETVHRHVDTSRLRWRSPEKRSVDRG